MSAGRNDEASRDGRRCEASGMEREGAHEGSMRWEHIVWEHGEPRELPFGKLRAIFHVPMRGAFRHPIYYTTCEGTRSVQGSVAAAPSMTCIHASVIVCAGPGGWGFLEGDVRICGAGSLHM